MKKIGFLGVFAMSILLVAEGSLNAHYRPEQYLEANQGLSSVVSDLSKHLNVLENIANQVEQFSAQRQDPLQKYRASTALEILHHHAMRAWYNRLLLQNLAEEAISLGQMSTIVRLSIKPMGNGIYQLEKIGREEEAEEPRQVYQKATEALRTILALYEEALQLLRAAIQSGA